MLTLSKNLLRSSIALSVLLFLAASMGAQPNAGKKRTAKKKVVIGRVEMVEFPQLNINLEARIDTGAHTCSMHVVNEKVYKRGKLIYIEFDTEDRQGKVYHMKAQVHRITKVKNTSGSVSQRYVIRQKLRIGKVTRLVNINLNDRTELKYNFLVGRNFLRGRFLVDVALSHTQDEKN